MSVEYLNLALDKLTWAGMVIKNYYVDGNTYDMTEDEMKQIEDAYGSTKYAKLRDAAEDDSNEYDIADTDGAYDEGWNTGEDTTGYDSKGQGWRTTETVLHSAVPGAYSAGYAIGNFNAAKDGIKNLIKQSDKGGSESFKNAFQTDNVCDWVTVALATASVARYHISKPNEKETDALTALQPVLTDAASASAQAQADMTTATSETTALSEDSDRTMEAANNMMADEAAEASLYTESLQALQEKIANGETLTESERNLYEAAQEGAAEAQANIDTMQGEAQEFYDENRADMEELSTVYDDGASTIANSKGISDYSASFDQATKTRTLIEGLGQAGTAAGAAVSGAKLLAKGLSLTWCGAGIAYIAGGALGITASVMSGINSYEQFQFRKVADATVTTRKNTETVNTTAMETYDTEIDNYNTIMDTNQESTLEIPELPEVPEGDLPDDSGESTDNSGNTTDPNKKKPENN